MKKLSLFMAIIMIFSSLYIFSIDSIAIETISEEGSSSSITLENGKEYKLDGTPDTIALEQNQLFDSIESVDIYYDGSHIMEIIPNIVATSPLGASYSREIYYSITITPDDSTMEYHLYALTANNVETVKSQLISSTKNGGNFTLSNIDFIDAEKSTNSNDDSMCWAASASNLLYYTGWAGLANYSSPDEVFSLIVDNYTNQGSLPLEAISWFFNGSSAYSNTGWSRPKRSYSKTKFIGYLSDYEAMALTTTYDFSSGAISSIKGVINDLDSNYGVSLGVGFYQSSTYVSGHAITCYGYAVDNAYDSDSYQHYKGLLICDSDNTVNKADASKAANTLSYYNLSQETSSTLGYATWSLNNYSYYKTALTTATTLMPYSEDIEHETSENATRNKNVDVDICMHSIKFCTNKMFRNLSTTFLYGQTFYISPSYSNSTALAGTFNTDYSITVYDSNNKIVHTDKYNDVTIRMSSFSTSGTNSLAVEMPNDLEIGTYRVEAKFNYREQFTEAYMYNNTASAYIKIVDSKEYFDDSRITISPTISEDLKGNPKASLELVNYNDIKNLVNNSKVFVRYWNDDSLVEQVLISSNITSNKISTFDLQRQGNKLSFVLTFDFNGHSYSIESDNYDYKYYKIVAQATSEELPSYKIKPDTKSISPNKFEFQLVDASTNNLTPTGKVKYLVYAEGNNSTLKTTLFAGETTYSKTGENIVSISDFSISNSVTFNGKYNVYVLLFDYSTEPVLLGTLCAIEAQKSIVTTTEDVVDEYDDQTSLREAVEYASQTGENVTFDKSLIEKDIYINSPITIDNGSTVTIIGSVKNRTSYLSGSKIVSSTSFDDYIFNVKNNSSLQLYNFTVDLSNNTHGIIKSSDSDIYAYYIRILNSNGNNSVFDLSNSTGLFNIVSYTNNSSPLVALSNSSKSELLNCTIVNNSLKSGSIIKALDYSSISILYSTIENNKIIDDVIKHENECDIIASIITNNFNSTNKMVDVVGNNYESSINKNTTYTYSNNKVLTNIGNDNTQKNYCLSEYPLLSKSNHDNLNITVQDNILSSTTSKSINDAKLTCSFSQSLLSQDASYEDRNNSIGSKSFNIEFEDVKQTDYFCSSVLWAFYRNVTNGTDSTHFSPDDSCTRGQFVTLLYRALGSPEISVYETNFNDVKDTDYFYSAVIWAEENGITKGTSDWTFSPDDTCTRGQIITMIWRYYGSQSCQTSANFTDVASKEYYYTAVNWGYNIKVVNGTSDTTFSPEDYCSRCQIVTILYRLLALSNVHK